MKLPRRKFLLLAAGAAALAVSRIAWAQAYPSPVRIIVGFAAGGASDILARLLGQVLSERLGQQFVIENRTGAATNIATEAVVRAPPDGYTLLLVVPANAISATLYDNLNFNFIRDITPVASLLRVPFVMVANPSFPAKTVPEFITYAKANPGKVKWASTGNAFKAGKLHGLAVTTATRSEALPDMPTVDEFVPGYESSGWYGVGGPTGTPAEIVNKLNNEINAALADSQLKARLVDLGGTVIAGSPSDFGNFVAAETEKWGKVVRAANIKPE
jgi:tripartite-type tricarboxylate transporter receptor subunit TctC